MSTSNRREFARIDVRLRARFRIVRADEAEELGRELQETPSVWAPEGETQLIKLATSGSGRHEGLLAGAVLDISRQVARLSHYAHVGNGPAAVGEFRQLSASGGLFVTQAALTLATRLDLRFSDDDPESPPVRIMAGILREQPAEDSSYPLKFLSIHPTDQERLIRFLHLLQRRRLRQASLADR